MNIENLTNAQEDYITSAENCGLTYDGLDYEGQPVFIGSHKAFDKWDEVSSYLTNPFDSEPNLLEETD